MPYATADDGVKLYYEVTGSGSAVIFVHEFAGDHRSWEPQIRFLSRYFRCIAYNARGYPPSDVPEDAGRYSQARARDDAIAVLDHLNRAVLDFLTLAELDRWGERDPCSVALRGTGIP